MSFFGRLLRWGPMHKALPFVIVALLTAPLVFMTRSANVRMTIHTSRVTLGEPSASGQILLPPQVITEVALSGPATLKSAEGTRFMLAPAQGSEGPRTSVRLDDPVARLTFASPASAPLRFTAVDLGKVSRLDVRHDGGADEPTTFRLATTEPVTFTFRATELSIRCDGCKPDTESNAADWTGSAKAQFASNRRGAFATLSAGAPGLSFAIRGGAPVIIGQPTDVTGELAFETLSADGLRRVSAVTQKSEIVIEDTGKKIEIEPGEFVVVGQPHKLKLLSLARTEGSGLKLEFHGEVPRLATGRSPQALKEQLPSWLSHWYQKKDESWLLWLSVSVLLGGTLLKIAIEVGWIKGKEKS